MEKVISTWIRHILQRKRRCGETQAFECCQRDSERLVSFEKTCCGFQHQTREIVKGEATGKVDSVHAEIIFVP